MAKNWKSVAGYNLRQVSYIYLHTNTIGKGTIHLFTTPSYGLISIFKTFFIGVKIVKIKVVSWEKPLF